MMKHAPASELVPILGALALAVSVLSCGPPGKSAQGAESNAPGGSSGGREAAGGRSGGGARDLEALDLCALVPAADAARILGYEPSSGSAKASMGQWATDCTYSFARGEGSSDYVMIWAYPPQLWAPDLKDKIEEVSGLGDAANLTSLQSFAQINVLLEGDLYLDIRANTPEQARALAELALERLAG